MSDNKKASIRYEALDKCFRNTSRRFFIEDFRKACNAVLYRETGDSRYSNPDTPYICKKQIYDDIQFLMCSPKYYVPIEKGKEGRNVYYFYSNPSYSIVEKPLTDDEITKLEAALQVFLSFSGLPQFEWIEDIVCKLKSKYKVTESGQNVVSIDSNIDIAGLGFFNEILYWFLRQLIPLLKVQLPNEDDLSGLQECAAAMTHCIVNTIRTKDSKATSATFSVKLLMTRTTVKSWIS